ncbi:proline racemase family protein [Desulfonatronum sp. SC1]|uniref:proline racemase family protein n=1 Tax=Desulfonatronum sp. SC1 TaxID=2109626 RepID=UPI000D309D7F|nr:proline racemase family protein [Desulfonatronum sp. SC1]PTN34451.1 hypothetical protein C6366_12645 [Desulfonatronum sp. SC1]
MNASLRAEDVSRAFFTRHPRRVQTVDSHTGGEATRLIVSGIGLIPGPSMTEKRCWFQQNLDPIRLRLTREPRGHRDMVAAALTEPVSPGAAFGLIYMDACRYPHLCGHATIGAVTSMLELGLLDPGRGPNDTRIQPSSEDPFILTLVVDTPSGPLPVEARLDPADTSRVSSVTLTSVPAFVFAENVYLDVPPRLFGLEWLRVDLVCVGGFFAMVDLDQPGLEIDTASSRQIIDLGMEIIHLANEQVRVHHPLRPDVATVDVTEFYRHTGRCEGHGFVVYGESHLDRSPCGTGTTAKLTLLRHKGLLTDDTEYVNSGPLRTTFTARVHEQTTVGDYPAVTVRFTGSSHLTGLHEFVLDPNDPFPEGYLL